MFVFSPADNRYPDFLESLLGCVQRLGAPPGARRPGRSAKVTIDLLPDRVCLSPLRQASLSNQSASLSTHHTELHRPAGCPVAKIADGAELPAEQPDADPRRRYTRVAAAAAVLLESSDGRLLLTRRPPGMSAFPEVWVPPGGHLDPGETAAQAAARELAEEVGLSLPPDGSQGLQQPVRLLTAWESVYPACLSIGRPSRHHLVLYFHARLAASAIELTRLVKPQPREVDRLAWIDKRLAWRIGRTLLVEEGDAPADGDGDCEQAFDEETVTSWTLDGTEIAVPVSSLLSCKPDASDRVTTGTKMALLEWLRLAEDENS